MRDRSEQILRIACLTLAALVVLQLVFASFQVNPLAGVKIPAVPVLETNANAGSVAKIKIPSTNSSAIAGAKVTTIISTNASTNLLTVKHDAGTNLISTNAAMQTGTNNNVVVDANVSSMPALETNANSTVAPMNEAQMQSTNLPVAVETKITISASTNPNLAARVAMTNRPMAGTNPAVAGAARISRNSLPPGVVMAGGISFGGGPMMPGMPGMPGNAPKLPPEIQSRVDKIVSSEIFAPVMHPMPMGLLGIAGETAFLRAASGQTGLVKAGDSLGDLKLLKIGVNRVLVEQNGQKQELMIFDGYGGDSLLSDQDKISK
jgi:hypothetical protein